MSRRSEASFVFSDDEIVNRFQSEAKSMSHVRQKDLHAEAEVSSCNGVYRSTNVTKWSSMNSTARLNSRWCDKYTDISQRAKGSTIHYNALLLSSESAMRSFPCLFTLIFRLLGERLHANFKFVARIQRPSTSHRYNDSRRTHRALCMES